MKLWLWCVICIPVMLGCMSMHFKLKEWDKKPWNIVPKCLCTWMVVCTGILGIRFAGNQQGMEKIWLLMVLIFFLFADALLEVQFLIGMAVFGIGHGVLIFWFLKRAAVNWKTVALWDDAFLVSQGIAAWKEKSQAVSHDIVSGNSHGNDVYSGDASGTVWEPVSFGWNWGWAV